MPPYIISLKVPYLEVLSLPDEPKWHTPPDVFFEWCCLPNDDLVSYVWFLSTLLISLAGLPALGRVHLGKFYFSEGLDDASGTYLPGPTELGVDV